MGQFGVRGRVWFWSQSLAVTSIAASVATAPFAFYHFERLAPLGLIANLVAMPVVSLLSVPAAGLAIVLAPFGISEWGLRAFGGSLEIVLEISHWANSDGTGFSTPVRSMPPAVLLAFSTTLISFVLFRRWLRWMVCLLTGLGAALLWATIPVADGYWSPSGEVYLNLDQGGSYTTISVMESDALGPLRFQESQIGDACTSESCLFTLEGGRNVIVMPRVPFATDCRPSDPPVLILVSEPISPEPEWACPNVLSWQSILNEGGARFKFSEGQVSISHARKCSLRPWRRCQ